MSKIIFVVLVILTFLLSACTLYLPYDYEEFRDFRVIFLVDPDTAQIVLNGKFVGEAYEFSTQKSALRLSSRDNEIIVRKEGYIEEVIDLYEYDTRIIKIRLKLLEDKGSTKERKKEKPFSRKYKPTVAPKTLPVQKSKEEPEEKKDISDTYVNVILEIYPEESSIYLDGKFWGISPESKKIENLRLKSAKYTLEIVKPGYKSYKKILDIKKGKDLKLLIKLKK